MTKLYLQKPTILLLLAGLIFQSCNGQEKTKTNKAAPKITGTPPIYPFNPAPTTDVGLVSQYFRSIFQDSKGNLWFGPLDQGVIKYDEKTLHYFSNSELYKGNYSYKGNSSVHAITEDKEGNIWLGTYNGAIKYDGTNFRSYTEKDGLGNNNIGRKSILVDKSGTIWVGTLRGVFQYNSSADTARGKSFTRFKLLPVFNVKGIMEDKSGNIWFASEDLGVFRYNPSASTLNGELAILHLNEKPGLGDNYAGGMAQDKQGKFWFTMKGGICRYDPSASKEKAFTEYINKDGLGGNDIRGIYIEKSGIIWITARGTTRFDPTIPATNPKAYTLFTTANGLNCCVQSMYQDKYDNMWWGTGQGLYRFNGKNFYQVKQNGPW